MPRRNRSPVTGITIDSPLMKSSRIKRLNRAQASLKASQKKSHNSRHR